MFWTLALAAAVARSDFFTNENYTQNESEGWMAHLRRQLMEDNYDYQPSSDEPGLLPGLLDEEPPERDPDDEPRNRLEDETTTVNDLYVPTFRNYPDDLEPPSDMKQNTGRRLSRLSALANVSRSARRRPASQQDLLYYVDDAWLHREDDGGDNYRGNDRNYDSNNDRDNDRNYDQYDRNNDRNYDRDHYRDRDNNELSSGESDGRRAFEPAPASKTYKLLKVPGSARRDGLSPRFVEERSARGVALLSLDGAPFPPFRLPRHRRQYQDAELD